MQVEFNMIEIARRLLLRRELEQPNTAFPAINQDGRSTGGGHILPRIGRSIQIVEDTRQVPPEHVGIEGSIGPPLAAGRTQPLGEPSLYFRYLSCIA